MHGTSGFREPPFTSENSEFQKAQLTSLRSRCWWVAESTSGFSLVRSGPPPRLHGCGERQAHRGVGHTHHGWPCRALSRTGRVRTVWGCRGNLNPALFGRGGRSPSLCLLLGA